MSTHVSRFSPAVGALIALLAISIQSHGQIAVRIPDKTLEIRGIVVTPLSKDAAGLKSATTVQQTSGEIWLATNDGLYVVNERTNETARVPEAPSDLKSLFAVETNVWACANGSICRVDPRDRHTQTIPFPEVVLDMDALDRRVWLVTKRGVYRLTVGDGQPAPVSCQSKDIRCAKVIPGNEILVGASEGIYVGTNGKDQVYLLPDSPTEVQCMEYASGRLWVGTARGLYFMDARKQFRLLEDSPPDIRGIQETNGLVWFMAGNGIFTISKKIVGDKVTDTDRASLFKLFKDGQVIRTFQFRKTTIGHQLSSSSSASRRNEIVTNPEWTLSQEIWVGGSDGVYLYKENPNHDTRPRRIPDEDLSVGSIKSVNGRLWAATNKGAYRIDTDVAIRVDIQSEESWWKSVIESLFPRVLRVSGVVRPVVQYTKLDGTPLVTIDPFDTEPTVIIEMNKDKFDKASAPERRDLEYGLPTNIGKPLDAGSRSVYYSVRDRWRNTFDDTIPVFVIPGPLATSGLLVVVWITSFVLIIAFAPWSVICHMMLMNRQIRKYGYFNLAHIVITVVRPVRRHVLRRYLKGVRADRGFSEWRARFVVPSEDFLPTRCLELVREHRKLLLLGQSGIGKTSYFRYLISSFSSQSSTAFRLGDLVPVFIPLGRYRGSNPTQMVHTQLASYGQLTDEEITTSCLENGGILIFLDGLNEIDSTTRNLVNTFVERYWVMNYFVISSQEDYPEFAGKRIYLATLDPERVNELLRRRLGEERANSLSSQLTSDAYMIYKIPLDLELAIGLLASDPDGQLPQSRRELYERTLRPVWDQWHRSGRSEYSELLISRAYQMVRSSDPVFDRPDNPAQIEIRNDLLRHRLLVARGDQYYFAHEEIGAFLAAKYFAPRFRDLLPIENSVDFSWLPMLRFAGSYLRESKRDIRDLVFSVVEKNKFLAIELFKWLETIEPALLKGWTSGFKRKLGGAMLD